MIVIQKELIVRLEAIFTKINKVFGSQSTINTVEEYANLILKKHVEKKEKQLLQTKNNDNKGLNWIEFRRKHFDEIWFRDRGRCQYCDVRLTRKTATIDHKISPLRGGQNRLENVCLACAFCNNDKEVLTPEEYIYKQMHNAAQGIYPPGK